MKSIIKNKYLIACIFTAIIMSFSIYAQTMSNKQKSHSEYINNFVKRYAEAMFRIGYITIEEPVVIECGTVSQPHDRDWRLIRYVTSISNIPQIIADGTISDSEYLYILCDDLTCAWDRLYWNVIYAQHPNLRSNDRASFIDALGDYNLDFECCKLTEWKSINDSIRLLRYKQNPACFALALVNIDHYNDNGATIDGPGAFINSEKPKSSYVKCVAPVCCFKDSSDMPELLPWCAKENINIWDSGKSPWHRLTDIRDTRYMKI